MFLGSRTSSRSLCVFLVLAVAGATGAQDAGFRGPSYAGADSFPSGTKPQSKLWWNDGSWWGCLWSTRAQFLMIHRLDPLTQRWIDTGTAVEGRTRAHADCLWDGGKLYVATNRYTSGHGEPGDALELRRYGYDPDARVYSLDVGFPVLIGDSSTEALTIEKDSTGRLWAAWSSDRRMWFAHSLQQDRSWSLPAIHPRITADLDRDDIGAIVAFQGDKIGMLWSDQVADAFQFTFHLDSDPDSLWSPIETVVAGPGIADDHVSLRASSDGRVFAALKTTTGRVLLAERSAGGTWTVRDVASAADDWNRPILLLDEAQRVLHVFATSPGIQGAIFEKTSPMDAIAFSAGIGTPALRDARGPAFNDATSTKQALDGTTALVVVASDQLSQEYGHHSDALGGPRPAPPRARLGVSEERGPAPLRVRFLDSSSCSPAQWAWDFGDGVTSSAQHPVHTYVQAGSYTVSLRVTNGLGTDAITRPGLVVVTQPASLRLRAREDGHVYEGAPGTSFASLDTMRVRENGSADYRSFVKFNVPPQRNRITAGVLRLACTDGSPDGGRVEEVGDAWSEPSLSWASAPELGGVPVGLLGEVANGATVTLDLGATGRKCGWLSLGILSTSTNSAMYSTREGANPPELELTLQPWGAGPPSADLEADRDLGFVPMTVQFFDGSSGPVDSYSWDFGDGTISNLQNPSHVFEGSGVYAVRLTVTGPGGSSTREAAEPVRALSRSNRNTRLLSTDRPAPVPATAEPSGVHGILAELARRLERDVPGLAPPLLSRAGRVLELRWDLAGELEDALTWFDECSSEAGLEVLGSAMAATAAGEPALELGLRSPRATARLRLLQRAGRVSAILDVAGE